MGGLDGVSTDLTMQLRRHGPLNDDDGLSPGTRSGDVSLTENERPGELGRHSSVVRHDPKNK